MSLYIQNAAPGVYNRGIENRGSGQPARPVVPNGQHILKAFIKAATGPKIPELVTTSEAEEIFGEGTFRVGSKFYNHQTLYANIALSEANKIFVQRITSPTAKKSNILIRMIVSTDTSATLYERDANTGEYIKNSSGALIPRTDSSDASIVGTVHTVSFEASSPASDTAYLTEGIVSISATKKSYPIFYIPAKFEGEYGNDTSFSIWASSETTTNRDLALQNKSFPIHFSNFTRVDKYTSAVPVKTMFGSIGITTNFKSDVYDPITNEQLYFPNQYKEDYTNTSDPRIKTVYGELGDIHVYDDHLGTALDVMYATERLVDEEWSDFDQNDTDERYLVNFLSAKTLGGVPYESIRMTSDLTTVQFNQSRKVYLGGGSDGTEVNDDWYEAGVRAEFDKYADVDDVVQDMAINVESAVWDSGWSMDTKLNMGKIIRIRKDVSVFVATHIDGEAPLTLQEEYSRGVALSARLSLSPESVYYGTKTCRAYISMQSCRLRNSPHRGRVSTGASALRKVARYMGASNGRWKRGLEFDGEPGSLIDDIYDINVRHVPQSTRYRIWEIGLNWVAYTNRESLYFPSWQTVFKDDTSPLNSLETVLAAAYISKLTAKNQRYISGVSRLRNEQIVELSDSNVDGWLSGIFGGRFTAKSRAFISKLDQGRGWSLSHPVELLSPVMKTVSETWTTVFRIDN